MKTKDEREKVFMQALGVQPKDKTNKKDCPLTESEIRDGKDLREKEFMEAFSGKKVREEKKLSPAEREREKVFMEALGVKEKKEDSKDPDLKEEEAKDAALKKVLKENIKGIRAELKEVEKKIADSSLKSSDMKGLDKRVKNMSSTLCLRENQTSGLSESNLLKAVEVYERWERGEIHVPDMIDAFKLLGIFQE